MEDCISCDKSFTVELSSEDYIGGSDELTCPHCGTSYKSGYDDGVLYIDWF